MSGEYLDRYELTRMRVPGREAGLIPDKLIVLGENRRISGSPLGWSQPTSLSLHQKSCNNAVWVTEGTKNRKWHKLNLTAHSLLFGVLENEHLRRAKYRYYHGGNPCVEALVI
jgi:hypothetical protein